MAGNSSVALGFRFYPTEEELVGFYLRNKLEDKRKDMERVIPVLDVYSYEPSQLPQMSGEPCVWDLEQWFFFCPMQLSEAQGGRPTRTTSSGYWKATGSPAFVYSTTTGKAVAIGVKKTMVFYEGRAPRGTKTKWKMNEYRAFRFDSATSSPTTQPSPRYASMQLCNQFSLCRVYVKSGCPRAFDRRPSTSTSVAASTSRSHETTVAATGHNGSLGRSADAERSSSGHRGWGEDDYDWSLIQNMDWDF